MRSSWLTVAMKSSFSWSSCSSRSLALRSSAVAASSSVDFCSSRWLYSLICDASSRISITSCGPITSPPHDRGHHHPRRGGTDGPRQLPLGQLHQGRIGRLARQRARCRARGRRRRTPHRPGAGRGSAPAAPRSSPAGASPCHGRVVAPRWSTSTNCVACRRSRSLCSASSAPSSISPTLTAQLQTSAWLTGFRPSRPNRACGRRRPMPNGAVDDQCRQSEPANAGTPAYRSRQRSPASARPGHRPDWRSSHIDGGQDQRQELGHAAEGDQPDADQAVTAADEAEEHIAQQQQQQDAACGGPAGPARSGRAAGSAPAPASAAAPASPGRSRSSCSTPRSRR